MMDTPDKDIKNTDNPPLQSNIRKIALTALAGTSIEWYDFFLYGAAAALIFPKAFFPEATETIALILSLGTFAACTRSLQTPSHSHGTSEFGIRTQRSHETLDLAIESSALQLIDLLMKSTALRELSIE